jgi:hypothetical protein
MPLTKDPKYILDAQKDKVALIICEILDPSPQFCARLPLALARSACLLIMNCRWILLGKGGKNYAKFSLATLVVYDTRQLKKSDTQSQTPLHLANIARHLRRTKTTNVRGKESVLEMAFIPNR